MKTSWFTLLLMTFGLIIGVTRNVCTQEAAGQPAEEKAALEKKAVTLLEQVAAESGALRLAENRIRLQLIMGDLLWTRNEGRARALFDTAAAALLELMRVASANRATNRRNFDQSFNLGMQLRQELVMAAARHQATLAYQLLQATRLPSLPNDSPYNRQGNMEANLEQTLLAQIARTDPQLALKNAEEHLEKGQYPYSLVQVIADLQSKDKEAAARLQEKLLKQLLTENLTAKQDAANLAISLLRQGPLVPESAGAERPGTNVKVVMGNPWRLLDEATYRSLLEQVLSAALKDTSALSAQKSGANPSFATQEAAQREQNTIRMLVSSFQGMMPQIEKYAPTRVAAVRQKMNQIGFYPPANEYRELMQQGTSEKLLLAAAKAPENMRMALYQQAAMKAINEGDADRARQIINDHLDPALRNNFLRMMESQQLSGKSKELTMENVRQALSRLPTDEERFNLLIELSGRTRHDNPKLALEILEEAQRMVNGRATDYQQLNNQLQVAQAFLDLDTPRSFELLEPGITQLNELFPAAQALSGFDVNIFKDGEMLLLQGSVLASMVNQYAELIARLAQKDFDRAVATADKFQLPEARLFTRLTIVRFSLGGSSVNNRGFVSRPPPPPPRQ